MKGELEMYARQIRLLAGVTQEENIAVYNYFLSRRLTLGHSPV